MALKTRTVTQAVSRTTLTLEGIAKKDGGRSLLLETFDFIHAEEQIGQLTVQFSLGGSISSVIFEERETIPQKDIEVMPKKG